MKDFDNEHKRFPTEGPQPLVRELPEAASFPLHALGPLRCVTEAIVRITEAPCALAAGSALAVASLATQPLRTTELLVGTSPASLFIMTIAESGERKSTADRLAMQGVRDFEKGLTQQYRLDKNAHQVAEEIWKARRHKILTDRKADPDAQRADLDALGVQPPAPLLPHVVASDPTVEAIIKNLPQLRPSLGIMSEEGGAFLGGHGMKAENRLATFSNLSKMWDGTPLDRWRAGDGIAAYDNRRFTMHLLVQPVAAETLLADPIANGQGLLARCLIARPPSNIGRRTLMTHDPGAEQEVMAFAGRTGSLLARDLPLVDGTLNELNPPLLPLSPKAHENLLAYARSVEEAQAAGGKFETIRAFASKSAEQAARLATVLTVFEYPEAKAVSGKTMTNAIVLAEYYLREALHLTDVSVVPDHVKDAERMRLWLLERWDENYISASVAAQRGPFKDTEKSRKALKMLERYGWLVLTRGAIVKGSTRNEAWRIIRPKK